MDNLVNQEFEMFPFFEMTPDLVCIASKEGYFKKINHAVIEKLGYSEEELYSKPISSFIYDDDKDLTTRERNKLLNGKALINFQNRYVTKNGKIVWLDWTSVYFEEKQVVFAIAKDVTERKQIEKEVEEKYSKLKSLATHFKSSLEKDRKYVAMELHEELAQLATVVKLDIGWMQENGADLSATFKNKMNHAMEVSELLINAIRRISFSISPQMLEELGLDETMKWLCKEFSILNGIHCKYEVDYNETDLTHEVKLDFFRICQQSLSNVMFHAQANSVKVSIKNGKGKTRLAIVDDGKGFNVDEQMQNSGLSSIRDRVASINGELSIKSKPGKGTSVSVAVENKIGGAG